MEGSPGRLKAWTLVSRGRYALVWGGVNAVVVLGLGVVMGSLSVLGAFELAPVALLLSMSAQGWLWYPRAKRRLTARHG